MKWTIVFKSSRFLFDPSCDQVREPCEPCRHWWLPKARRGMHSVRQHGTTLNVGNIFDKIGTG